VSSGERKRMRLNRVCVIPGRGCIRGVVGPLGQFCRTGNESENAVVRGMRLESVSVEGETPVLENLASR
jgi:hypothetical protein